MKSSKRRLMGYSLLIFFVIAVGIGGWFLFLSSSGAQAYEREVREAWSLLGRVKSYNFSTTVEQRVFPAPLVSNAGLSSKLDVYHVEGWSRMPDDEMFIRFQQNDGSLMGAADAMEIRFKGGEAYGRTGQSDWQPIEDQGDVLFAPGKNAASFLVAARQVRLVSRERVDIPQADETVLTVDVSRYEFNLDGGRFAVYMRDQMVQQLQQAGKLPAEITLGLSDKYKGMQGAGVLWVDADGLPVRMLVDVQFPPEDNGEHLEAKISTDFFGVSASDRKAAQGFLGWTAGLLKIPASPAGFANAAATTGAAGSFLVGLLFLIVNSRSRWSYSLVAGLVIGSLLIDPLWRSGKAAQFTAAQAADQAQMVEQQRQEQDQREAVSSLLTSSWNPNTAPEMQIQALGIAPASGEADSLWQPQSRPLAAAAGQTDSDGDGVSDEYEDQFGATVLDKTKADTDGDGLLDGQELRLGLMPGSQDSDNDQITDNIEAAKFDYARPWYTNPEAPDTDLDGILDGAECPERSVTAANPQNGVCKDIDSDGVPDVFDIDDDNDGVPTSIDISPFYPITQTPNNSLPFTDTNPLKVLGTGVGVDLPVFMSYQFRPVSPEHLTYTRNVLDWPSGDGDGQIQRISDSTFANNQTNSQTTGDPRAANGDMRLIPMAEVRFTGNEIPLQLTNHYRFPIKRSEGDLEIELTGLSAASTRVTLVKAPAGSFSIFYGQGSCDLGNNFQSLGSLAQGNSADVQVPLGQFADGNWPFQIRDTLGKVTACQEAYPVAHGTLADRVVDESTLTPYGISVRAEAVSGDVLLYSPLQLVYDDGGSTPVAFSLRLPLSNQANRFNNSQQSVKMVWVINMLTDQCKPIDANWDATANGEWCDAQKYPAHFNQDISRVVHTYGEEFFLTGLSVDEERGVKLAVIFEDPQTDLYPTYFDPLWAISKGLQSSFLAGRTTNGARDMTIEEIRHRFDPQYNSDITDDLDVRFWGQDRNAFQVVFEGNLASTDAVIARMATLSTEIFNGYFNITTPPEEANLLFARETRKRSVMVGQPGNSCSAGTCSLDFAGEVESVEAVLNWSPYLRSGTEWKAFALEQFLDRLESRLVEENAFQPGDASDAARDLVDGKMFFARLYAEMLVRGMATLVELNGTPLVNPPAVDQDYELDAALDFIGKRGESLGTLAEYFAEDFLESLSKQPTLLASFGASTALKRVGMFFTTVGKSLKTKIDSYITKYLTTTFRKVSAAVGGAIFVAGLAACAILSLVAGDSQAGSIAGRVLSTTLGTISTLLALKGLYGLYQAVKAGQAVSNAAKTAAVIGLVIGIVINWVMFAVTWGVSGVGIGSLEFNRMLANALAATMTLVLMAVIAMIFPVGTIIAAVIGLIDAIIMTFCAAFGVKDYPDGHYAKEYICEGLSGLVTKAFQWFIYGQHHLINYDNGERLKIGGLDQVLERPNSGYVDSNRLSVNLEVTNTITKNGIPADWKSVIYFWQWSDSNAKSANFQYRIQTEETNFHDDLERGGMNPAWVDAGDDIWKADVVATTASPFAMPAAGVNREPAAYLSEASAVAVQECWAIPPIPPLIPFWIPVCYIRTAKNSFHTSLSNALTIDVFPENLSKFYTLTEFSPGGYSFNWGQDAVIKFPVFRDADGDTLISKYYGGNDPNDSLFDTDRDGLSDSFELSKGYNPNLFDSDDDGLNDLTEVQKGTDPMRKDSDGDGLTDKAEIDGWLFTYGFNPSGVDLSTMVYPDPLMPDTDLDGISDKQEQVYGFNPRVFSELDILDYDLQVKEYDAPRVMLQFEETSGSRVFADSSNYSFGAACQDAACPTAGIVGRYGSGLQFDGGLTAGNAGDVLEIAGAAQGLDFTGNRPFTAAFWIFRQGSGTILSKWSDAAGDRREFRLEISPVGNIRLVNRLNTAAVSTGSIPVGTWTHVAVRVENDQVDFIFNGNLDSNTAWSNPVGTGSDTPVPLRVGASNGTGGAQDFFEGALDELAIFDRALDASEVTARLMTARYNFNDRFVRPGEYFDYTSNVTNLLNNRFAYGLLTTFINPQQAVVNAAAKLLPRTFVLNPDTPAKQNTLIFTEQMQIEPSVVASGNLDLTQSVAAQIVDRRSESNNAEVWLKFDEAVGSTQFEDYSGANPPRNGVCGPCPAAGETGLLNRAVGFKSGQNTPIQLPSLSLLNLTNQGYTISLWVKPAAGSAGTTLDLLRTINGEFNLALVGQSSIGYIPRLTAHGTTWDASGWRSVLSGVWNHLVIRYNNLDQRVEVYINGGLIHTQSSVQALADATNLEIGGNRQQADYGMDDLRIFSRPLSVMDINRLAQRPVLQLNMDDAGFTDSSGYMQTVSHQRTYHSPDGLSIRGTSLNPNSGADVNYLQVSGNPLLDLSDGAFTFSVWIYPAATSDTSWQGAFGYESGRSEGYPALERSGRKLRLRFGSGSGVYLNESPDVLTENQWNHVAVTFQPDRDSPGLYEYRLYVNAGMVDSEENVAQKPASNTVFNVGHSSYRYTVTANELRVDSHDDAGSAAEPWVDKYVNGVGSRIFGVQDVYSGNTYGINNSTDVTDFSSVGFDVWEDDVIGDDHCGSATYYYYNSPGVWNVPMSDGFNGYLRVTLARETIRFIGRVDELSVYRYALDSEQIYDLYHAIPVTARLPLDDRPASQSFENLAEVTSLDDGVCAGAACPTAGTLGLIDQAVRFNSVDDVITIPNRDITDHYMVSLWINTVCGDCGLYSLYSTTPGGSPMQQIYLRGGNVCTLTGGTEMCSTGGGVADGEWHPVVYWNDGSRADLWLDGSIVNTRSGGSSITPSKTAEIRLGYAAGASNDYFDGQMDDVRVFRYTQSAQDIRDLLKRAPILMSHLDEPKNTQVFGDETQADWTLDCTGPACVTADQPGRLSRAVEFDGSDDLLTLTQNQLSADAQSLTVSMWVYPTRKHATQVQTLWTLPYADNNRIRYGLGLPANSMKLCLMTGQTGGLCTAQTNASLMMDNWNYVTLTVERLSSSAEKYYLYLNGYLDSSGTGNSGADVVNGLGRMSLGGNLPTHTSQPGGAFAGTIDEVSVYGYVLTEIDVRESFNYQIAQVEERESVALTIDAEAPSIAWTGYNPAFTYFQQSDTLLVVSASDATSGMALVEMRVDPKNISAARVTTAPVCLDSVSGEEFCPTFRPENSTEGKYSLSLRAVDRVGHETTSPKYDIYVDGKGPRVVLDILNDSLQAVVPHPTLEKTWLLDLKGSILDPDLDDGNPGSGLDPNSVRVTVLSQSGEIVGEGTQQPTLVKDTTGPGYRWELAYLMPEAEPTGRLTVLVEADDRVNNTVRSETHFYFDATAPSAKIDSIRLPKEDKILSGGELSGVVSDLPSAGLPYAGEDDPDLAVGVERAEGQFSPTVNASYLYNEPYPNGLLLWLPLDKAEVPLDTQGDPNPSDPRRTFIDLSPFQIAGSCEGSGCPQAGVTGHRGASMFFEGLDQLITLGNQVNLANRSFTAAVWSRRLGTGRNDPILWQGPVSLPDLRFLMGMNDQDQFVCGFGGSDLVVPQPLADDAWHSWACTFDQSSGKRTVYMDGQQVASDSTRPLPVMNEPLFVGQAPVGSYQGYLDELQIFDRALDPAKIRELYTGSHTVFHLAVEDDFVVSGDGMEDQSGFFHTVQLTKQQGDLSNKVAAGAGGNFGLQLDGNDHLAVDPSYSLNLERGQYTLAAWVRPEQAAEAGLISQMDENPEWRYPSLSLTADLRMRTGFGTGYAWVTAETTAPVAALGQWSHLSVTFDGKLVSFYVNGEKVGESNALAGKGIYPAETFNVGDGLKGGLDEVQVFPRALAAEEIRALAKQGWAVTALQGSGPTADWSLNVPRGIEGLYQIGFRGWDEDGHYKKGFETVNQWDGVVDTLAPRLVLTRTAIDQQLWEYRFSMEDLYLDETSIKMNICDQVTLKRTYNNSGWLLASGIAPNSLPFRIEGVCQGVDHQTVESGIYVCDAAGNCSAQFYPPLLPWRTYLPLIQSSGGVGQSVIAEPAWSERVKDWPVLIEAAQAEETPDLPELTVQTTTLGATDFRSASFFPIKGTVSDQGGIAQVEVRISRDGMLIYQNRAALIADRWTAMWAFSSSEQPQNGVYQLEVIATDLAGNQTRVTSELAVVLGGR